MSQLKPLNLWNATPEDVPRVTSVLEAWDESPTLSVMIALAKDLEIEKRKAEADLRSAQIRALEWCCDCADRAELGRKAIHFLQLLLEIEYAQGDEAPETVKPASK